MGGNGNGEHTRGNAADIVIYGQDGKPINTRFIACIAQDIGFTGIGRISDTAIHVDVRTSGKWYGDETVKQPVNGTTNTITNDYHIYYGIPKINL